MSAATEAADILGERPPPYRSGLDGAAATAASDDTYFARKSAHAPLSQICVVNLLLDYAYLG